MTVVFLLQSAAEQLQQAREGLHTPIAERLVGILGIAAMLAIAWALSTDRRKVNWRLVGMGVVLQAVFAFLVLKTGVGRALFSGANAVFIRLLGFTRDGASFLFGNLVNANVPVGIPTGAPPQISPLQTLETWANTGASFAFIVLPTIIFFSSLMSVLYYLGIMQRVVQRDRVGDAADDGHLGSGDAVGRGEHLRRADGGAAADQAVRGRDDVLRAQHGDGGRVRDDRGRRHGGLRRHAHAVLPRHRGAPADGERDERAGGAAHLQDPGAGDWERRPPGAR